MTVAHADRLAEIFAQLEAHAARVDRVSRDPIAFVHRARARGASLHDLELIALLASSLAFGNVTAIVAKLDDLFERLTPDVAHLADDPVRLRARCRGFVHRVYRAGDVTCLILGARAIQRDFGSIGEFFAQTHRLDPDDLRRTLATFVDRVRARGGLARRTTTGARHILPDPRASSANKRLLLFLRWMVRDDAIDLGLWREHLPKRALLVPVDVHILRLGRNLGFTDRTVADLRAAQEITAHLRAVDADDPVRFDFALCHYGMAAIPACPSERSPLACAECLLRPACRWWR